ncbi:MAG: hypothetical protein DMD58_07690 [Gemmatimonadetes bacterium]|nr:MAG: hypothetical protein DMD58_07690 [Gemmatimonadota bacterium]
MLHRSLPVRLPTIALICSAALASCTLERSTVTARDSASADYLQVQRQRRIGYDANGNPSPVALSEVVVTGTADSLPSVSAADVSNMVIRTATASIEVDSLETAVAELRQLATRVGGYVGGAGVATGKNQLRQAFIELKVPAGRFDEVVAGLRPMGRLESVNVNAQDVGEEYVDVTARIDNARRLEQRLIGLLATRTGKLKDVLDVEQTLARVREEIERYEGRIRYLRAHIAMSTLNVTLHEPLPIVAATGRGPIAEAFRQAWRNFVVLLSLAVQSLGVVLPLGFVAGGAWFVTRRWRVARQRAA